MTHPSAIRMSSSGQASLIPWWRAGWLIDPGDVNEDARAQSEKKIFLFFFFVNLGQPQ